MRLNSTPATTLPLSEINAVRGFKRLERFRLHLYNGKVTDWFDKDLLTTMVKKHEGRIISIAKEDV